MQGHPKRLLIKRGYVTEWTAGYCLGTKIFRRPEVDRRDKFVSAVGVLGLGAPFGRGVDSGSIVFDTQLRHCGLLIGAIRSEEAIYIAEVNY